MAHDPGLRKIKVDKTLILPKITQTQHNPHQNVYNVLQRNIKLISKYTE